MQEKLKDLKIECKRAEDDVKEKEEMCLKSAKKLENARSELMHQLQTAKIKNFDPNSTKRQLQKHKTEMQKLKEKLEEVKTKTSLDIAPPKSLLELKEKYVHTFFNNFL